MTKKGNQSNRFVLMHRNPQTGRLQKKVRYSFKKRANGSSSSCGKAHEQYYLPCWNRDTKFGSPGFILSGCKKQTDDFVPAMINFRRRQIRCIETPIYFPSKHNLAIPDSSARFCSVCRSKYDSYSSHVASQSHITKLKGSPFNKHMSQLISDYFKPSVNPDELSVNVEYASQIKVPDLKISSLNSEEVNAIDSLCQTSYLSIGADQPQGLNCYAKQISNLIRNKAQPLLNYGLLFSSVPNDFSVKAMMNGLLVKVGVNLEYSKICWQIRQQNLYYLSRVLAMSYEQYVPQYCWVGSWRLQ